MGKELWSPVGHPKAPSLGSLRLLAEDSPTREGGGWLGLGSRSCVSDHIPHAVAQQSSWETAWGRGGGKAPDRGSRVLSLTPHPWGVAV